jgi:hypothetical protein
MPDRLSDATVRQWAAGWYSDNSEVRAMAAELLALREAATALVRKIDRVHRDPRYEAVWCISQLHVGPYEGPQFKDELDALRELCRP